MNVEFSCKHSPVAGNEGVETKKIDKSSARSIPPNQSCDGEDNSYLEIIDEPEFDGKVNKRLDKITPIAVSANIKMCLSCMRIRELSNLKVFDITKN